MSEPFVAPKISAQSIEATQKYGQPFICGDIIEIQEEDEEFLEDFIKIVEGDILNPEL